MNQGRRIEVEVALNTNVEYRKFSRLHVKVLESDEAAKVKRATIFP